MPALAARIVEQLREEAAPAGRHLTEDGLAARFSVSRSPVRRALERLAERGLVRRERNRGFFLARPAAALGANLGEDVPAEPTDELYLRIADDRLRGALPDIVSESLVRRRYGVARWLAQRTLARLAAHGLLARRPTRGWAFPAELTSAAAYEQGFRFRLAIEPAALLDPAYRAPPREWSRVRDAQRRLLDAGPARFTRIELFQLGADFHEAIVAWSGNRYFLDAIRNANQVRRLFEYRAKVDRERVQDQTLEHLRILDLLADGAREQAAALLRRHIEEARRRKAPLFAATAS